MIDKFIKILNSCARNSFSLALLLCIGTSSTALAGWPSGYYDSLNGKKGAELMNAVKSVVASHTDIPYGENGTWKAFLDTDVRTVNGEDYWWDMYSNDLVLISSGHPGLNIEHSVANSWWGGTKNLAYRDIVHLNPSNSDANSRKSNYPLSELESVYWDNGVTFVGTPKSGQGGGNSWGYEPADQYKGDFARVFMYMFTIYNDIAWKSTTDWMYDTSSALMFKDWARDLLLRWSSSDPVSEKEQNRNDAIYKHQANRNPFIDLPDLADHIWGDKANQNFYVDESLNPGEPDTPDTPDDPEGTTLSYTWLGEDDLDMGEWTIQDVELPEESSYVWKWSGYDGKNYLKGSCFVNSTAYASESYAWSPVVSLAGMKKAVFSFQHAAKFQTTLRSICRVVVKDTESGDITELLPPVWPAAGSWSFAVSGDMDLSQFAGKDIQLGFKYKSETSGADTWELRNAKLTLTPEEQSGVNAIPDNSDDSFLVEVWGNCIAAPEGARIFDLNGREFDGINLQPGIYIVVKPTFSRAVKVAVGR